MPLTLRSYGPRDFAALHKLDQSCFPAGISYSKITLRYFLTLPSADCVVAEDGGRIVGFIVSEENPPLAHIITPTWMRSTAGTALLARSWRRSRATWPCAAYAPSCWKPQPIMNLRLPSGRVAAIVSRRL